MERGKTYSYLKRCKPTHNMHFFTTLINFGIFFWVDKKKTNIPFLTWWCCNLYKKHYCNKNHVFLYSVLSWQWMKIMHPYHYRRLIYFSKGLCKISSECFIKFPQWSLHVSYPTCLQSSVFISGRVTSSHPFHCQVVTETCESTPL